MIPLRCLDCGKVRRLGSEWILDSLKDKREVEVLCPKCFQDRQVRQKKADRAMSDKLLRDRERTYGGPAPGENPFKGFREGDK